jgi:hypothetical protein
MENVIGENWKSGDFERNCYTISLSSITKSEIVFSRDLENGSNRHTSYFVLALFFSPF